MDESALIYDYINDLERMLKKIIRLEERGDIWFEISKPNIYEEWKKEAKKILAKKPSSP